MQPSNNKMSNSEIRKSNLVPSFNMKYFLISFAKDLALLQPGILIQASAEFYWVRQLIRCLSVHRYVRSERATTLSRVRHILHMYNESLSRARHTITLYVYLTLCLVPKDIGTEGHHIIQEHIVESMSFEHNRHHHTTACYLYTFESPSHKHIIRNMLQYGHYSYVSLVHTCTIAHERVTPAHC